MRGGGASGPGRRLGELARVFLKLGVLGFGGPAAHIAMLEDEVVSRRRWFDRDRFLDLVGATHLIPGPNSTELAIHIGLIRAGAVGLLVAGACFILPAVALTMLGAWAYAEYGTLPRVAPFLEGLQPAVVAVIFAAVLRLGRRAIRGPSRILIALSVVALVSGGLGEVPSLFAGALLGTVALRRRGASGPPAGSGGSRPSLLGPLTVGSIAATAPVVAPFTLLRMAGFFLWIGSVLYGGGYALFAFLEGQLVGTWGWLTEAQLLDAWAVGLVTPGPILTVATFIGYQLAGGVGALLATVSILLPSFILVGALHSVLPRLRERAWTAAFLDAVNASAVALMAVALVSLGRAALLDASRPLLAWGTAGVAVFILLRWRPGPAWVVLGGALVGVARALIGA